MKIAGIAFRALVGWRRRLRRSPPTRTVIEITSPRRRVAEYGETATRLEVRA
jgi:hypothetical protein